MREKSHTELTETQGRVVAATTGTPNQAAELNFAKRHWYALALILLIAFVLRSSAAVVWQSRVNDPQAEIPGFHFGDSGTYWHLARQIAQDEPYEFGSPFVKIFRTPGYPLVLAPLFWLSDHPSPLSASLINVVLGTLTVALVCWLAQVVLADTRVSLVAALLCACEPGAVGMSVFILSEGPFCPLMILNLICWIKAIRADSLRLSITLCLAVGICAGLAVLIRPSWLLFLPFAAGLLFVFSGQRGKVFWQTAIIFVSFALVMLPWWIRNYQAVKHFVPTTLQTGSSLYDGWNPAATGSSDMRFVEAQRVVFLREQFLIHDPSQLEKILKLDPTRPTQEAYQLTEILSKYIQPEYEFDQFLKRQAIRWARQHPVDALLLGWRKLVLLWSPFPSGEGIRNPYVSAIIALAYVPLILLALFGLKLKCCEGAAIWLLVFPAVYFTLLHCVFVSSIRYRQPAMLPLLIMSAYALIFIWQKYKTRRQIRTSQSCRG
jgi:4-amino-4-deoxy-L-arabinose transferase-like glycosyltransferase